jgi:hypothetical protein
LLKERESEKKRKLNDDCEVIMRGVSTATEESSAADAADAADALTTSLRLTNNNISSSESALKDLLQQSSQLTLAIKSIKSDASIPTTSLPWVLHNIAQIPLVMSDVSKCRDVVNSIVKLGEVCGNIGKQWSCDVINDALDRSDRSDNDNDNEKARGLRGLNELLVTTGYITNDNDCVHLEQCINKQFDVGIDAYRRERVENERVVRETERGLGREIGGVEKNHEGDQEECPWDSIVKEFEES